MMIMMRLLIVILIVVVGAAALSQLNPSAEKSTNPIINGLAAVQSWFRGASAPKQSGNEKETTVYKWQDAEGAWQFSNQPPPAGVASSVTTYRSDTNITQPPPAPVEKKPEPAAEQATAIPTTPAPLLPITDPERVKQLIDDAKNVQNLVNDRQSTLDKQIDH